MAMQGCLTHAIHILFLFILNSVETIYREAKNPDTQNHEEVNATSLSFEFAWGLKIHYSQVRTDKQEPLHDARFSPGQKPRGRLGVK